MIEILGRRGDVRSQEGGTDAPGLVRGALSSALSPGGSASGDELAA
ncbi:MAG: hypothetical protein HY720_05795 [Planctomycetes bacterium]|nr:hypothetical protein [Planctomycetota bacterium]